MKKITSGQYVAIHTWLRQKYGGAVCCENIACKGRGSRFEYCLKKGEKHKRDRGSYIQLCSRCHKEYDKHTKKWKRETSGIQIRVSPSAYRKLRLMAAKSGKYLTRIVDNLLKI